MFAAIDRLTEPLPVPLAPLAIVTQLALSAVVQAHADVVVTATVPDPAALANDSDSGDTVKAHGVSACETVTVCPATVIVAVRAVVAVLAWAE